MSKPGDGLHPAGDWWENYEARAFPGLQEALLDEQGGAFTTATLYCGASNRAGPYRCTRPRHHLGRHVAMGEHRPASAWPGDLPPTLEDLK